MFVTSSRIACFIEDFHQAFALPIDASRTDKLLRHRADLIAEEANEAIEALGGGTPEEIAKELADVILVVYGCAVALGIDLELAIEKVHASNMTKLVDGKPLMREDGKVLKGPNYIAPDMSDCI